MNSCFGPEVNSSRISEAEQPIKLREKQYPPREYMLKCIIIFVKTLCKSVLFLLRDCMIDETISSISKSYFRATYTINLIPYMYEHIKKTAGIPEVIHVAKRFLLFHKWIPFLPPSGSSAQKAQFALDNFSQILPRFSGGDV